MVLLEIHEILEFVLPEGLGNFGVFNDIKDYLSLLFQFLGSRNKIFSFTGEVWYVLADG
jgi:hypothetical protein